MNLPQPLQQAFVIKRLNRFAARIDIGGKIALAHVPNSGRLGELIFPGAEVYAHPVDAAHRRTTHDLVLARHKRVLVSVDSRAPNHIAAEALQAGGVSPLGPVDELRTEVALADRRIDLWARVNGEEWLIETKGCSLVRGKTAIFPDAPTIRGRHHVEALTNVVKQGGRAMVLFVIQRSDAREFRPNSATDPELCEALLRARDAGVVVAAYRCRVSQRAIKLTDSVPVHLDGPLPDHLLEDGPCA
ncbi:MAG TPA: DNA/RNA nuclease SfsA [Armatimonadota bacterium]|nr:DNA/RNA nuclease SfsA [Armatimonadota bacterium]